MRLRALRVLVAVAGVAASLGVVTPAVAADANSFDFAGYQVNGGGNTGKQDVWTHFRVPSLDCTSARTAIAPSISIGGAARKSAVGLAVGCSKSKPIYFGFIEVNGNNQDYNPGVVLPHDTVILHLVSGPSGASLTFNDTTRGFTEKRTGAGDPAQGYPAVGDGGWHYTGQGLGAPVFSAPSSYELGVPDFGALSFEDCTVNGKPMKYEDYAPPQFFGPISYNRVSSDGKTVQIFTGNWNSSGKAFTTYFGSS